MKTRKKLIEVALPLEAINTASAREKSIRHGHPSNLHRWWARRPQVAARSIIFAQLVDDPSEYYEDLINKADENSIVWKRYKKEYPGEFNKAHFQEYLVNHERVRLFKIIEELSKWENTTNLKLIEQARDEIRDTWRRACQAHINLFSNSDLYNPSKIPAFHDPFAGGGALPLEAQRLGLEVYASDLNPVAVIINKAMIEIPTNLVKYSPINPTSNKQNYLITPLKDSWQGLKEDIGFYAQWIRDEAEKKLGHLYPKIEITEQMTINRPDLRKYIGRQLTPIAYVWARTVFSPNPAFSSEKVPLASSFVLSNRKGKETYIQPKLHGEKYEFVVKVGNDKEFIRASNGTKIERANFRCLLSDVPISGEYIKKEGKLGKLGQRMMAIVLDGDNERVYLSPSEEIEKLAFCVTPEWIPDIEISGGSPYLGVKPYGMNKFSELFLPRQLHSLNVLSGLVKDVYKKVLIDATQIINNEQSAKDFARMLTIYLSLALSKTADTNNALCPWEPTAQCPRQLFGRQAYTMIWDYAEANPLTHSSGGFLTNVDVSMRTYGVFVKDGVGRAIVSDATMQDISYGKIISTDPPYYDNVPYADISDFFYIWLRQSLIDLEPSLFTTITVPKKNELVAFAHKHKNKEEAGKYFLNGMTKAISQMALQAHPEYPVTIYYAFKQAENDENGIASTGWEKFLEAVINSGFSITGTWPIRTEMTSALKNLKNSLASSIVLVCRKKSQNNLVCSRRDFINVLSRELPPALIRLQMNNIAPVDMAQSAIGPGMEIFTRYKKVIDAEGKELNVRQALTIINQIFDETFANQENEFDSDTRWALAWFEQYGFNAGEYGVAETLSKAKDTSVSGLADAGILLSGRGKVRLLNPSELPDEWDPSRDKRVNVWEMVHQLIRVFEKEGEPGAARLVAQLGSAAETARELCYRLYTICERKKRASEALSYNALVQSWPEIMRLAREQKPADIQERLF